jgi:hypothetical protein
MNQALPPRQGVTELLARRKGGGTRGQYSQMREDIRAYFQQPGGVAQLVNLVKHHNSLRAVAKKKQRIAHHVLHGRQVAIDVKNSIRTEALGQYGLARAADAAQPCDWNLAPSSFNPLQPKRSCDHASELYIWHD